jgi:hypothetical protein
LKTTGAKFTRFTVFVPDTVFDFANKHGVKLDVQGLALSAIAGYLNTFASLSPESKLPLLETRQMTSSIGKTRIPTDSFCPFCLMYPLDKTAQNSFADCSYCSFLLDPRKTLLHEERIASYARQT